MERAVLSIDIAQRVDYTALVVVRPRPGGAVHIPVATRFGKNLGYGEQADMILGRVRMLIDSARGQLDLVIPIDRGKSGDVVEEMLRARLESLDAPRSRVHVVGIDITGGSAVSGSPRTRLMSVSKDALKNPTARLMAQDRLSFGRVRPFGKIPRELPAELLGLTVLSENPTTGRLQWGSVGSQHDDLALACVQGILVCDRLWGSGAVAEFVGSATATANIPTQLDAAARGRALQRAVSKARRREEAAARKAAEAAALIDWTPTPEAPVTWERTSPPGYAIRRTLLPDGSVRSETVAVVTEEQQAHMDSLRAQRRRQTVSTHRGWI